METVTKDNFWNQAGKFGKLNYQFGEWPTISPGTEEWSAWHRYFQQLGWFPEAFLRVTKAQTKQSKFTVPSGMPSGFDPNFRY